MSKSLENWQEDINERAKSPYKLLSVERDKLKRKTYLTCFCSKEDYNGEVHGEFKILPNKLFNEGQGCPKCSKKRKIDYDYAVHQANLVHNGLYGYKDIIKGTPLKIVCECKEHGEFQMSFQHHLSGQGCPKCRYIKSGQKVRKNHSDFIKQVNELHTNIEEYDILSEYITNKDYIDIYCKCTDENGNEHGLFKLSPNNILSVNKEWCPKCGMQKNILSRRNSEEKWIEKAKKKHRGKYIYDEKLNYTDSSHKVNILCPTHGYFSMAARNHLFGQGCPICKESKLEKEVAALLSDNNIEFIPQKRFKWLGRQSLDFYLTEYNLAIECQGKQHFGLGGWSSSQEEFVAIKERDELKRKLCEVHGIKILYYTNIKLEEYPYDVITDKNELLNKLTIL